MSRTKGNKIYNDNPVSRFITKTLLQTDKTQDTVVHEIGLNKSNIMSMFKQGRTPFPIKYVIPYSISVGCDPEQFMLICLKEYFPDVLSALETVNKGVLNKDESAILKSVRTARASNPFETSAENLKKLRQFIIQELV